MSSIIKKWKEEMEKVYWYGGVTHSTLTHEKLKRVMQEIFGVKGNLNSILNMSHSAKGLGFDRNHKQDFQPTPGVDYKNLDFDKVSLPFEGEEDPYLTEKRTITLNLESLIGVSDAHGLEFNGQGIKTFYTDEDLDVRDLLDLEWSDR